MSPELSLRFSRFIILLTLFTLVIPDENSQLHILCCEFYLSN